MKRKDDAMGKWLVLVSLLRVLWIGYFRVPETLTFKTTISAKPFLWKWDYLHENKKLFFISRASQTALLWNRDLNNWQKAYCARPIPCLEFLCNISSMRRSVSSPDETLRRELKIRRVAEYFWWTSRCFISGADLGEGCRGCAPSPEITCGFLIQLVFCKKKTVVYWCWSRARDECTPS